MPEREHIPIEEANKSEGDEKKLEDIFEDIERGRFNHRKLRDVPEEYHNKIAAKLIDKKLVLNVLYYLDYFYNLNEEIMERLKESGRTNFSEKIENYLQKNKPQSEKKENERLPEQVKKVMDAIERNEILPLLRSNKTVLQNIPEEFHNEIAHKLLDLNKGYIDNFVEQNLGSFIGLDKEIAYKLINKRRVKNVIKKADSFQGLELNNETLKKIIDSGYLLDDSEIEKFSGFDNETARMFIQRGGWWYIDKLIKHINKFPKLESDILIKCIDRMALLYDEHLDRFILDEKAVLELAKRNEMYFLKGHIEKFSISKNLKKFILKDGVKEGEEVVTLIEATAVYDQTIEGKLKAAKSADKSERADKIKEFKKELADYKKELGDSVREAVEVIKEHPDINEYEFFARFDGILIKHGFNPKPSLLKDTKGIAIPLEYYRAKKVFRDYKEKRTIINKVWNEYETSGDIFMQLSGAKPKGNINMFNAFFRIHITCENEEDYAKLYVGKSELSEDEIKEAYLSGGFHGYRNIEKIGLLPITAEKGLTETEYYTDTELHEEEHAINGFFKKAIIEGDINGFAKQDMENLIENKDYGNLYRNIEKIFREYRKKNIEPRAADEIRAYFTNKNMTDRKVKYLLLENKGDKGLYDYSYDIKKDWRKGINDIIPYVNDKDIEKIKPYCEEAIDKVFKKEYEDLINKSVDAALKLKAIYGEDKMISILRNETLSHWDKTVKRILAQEKN